MGRVVTAEARLESTLKRFGVSSNENKTALLIGNNVRYTSARSTNVFFICGTGNCCRCPNLETTSWLFCQHLNYRG